MDKAGGPLWEQWKAQALEAGAPIVPGEETAHQPVAKQPRQAKPPAAWKLRKTKSLAERAQGGGQDTVPGEAMEAAEEDAQRVKQLSGPGAVFRPAEKPKTLRGEVSSS